MSMMFRPQAKAQRSRMDSFASSPDMSGDPTMRYVDLHSATPWTTSEKSWKAVSAPMLWPQELRSAATPPAEIVATDDDPFAPEMGALDEMRRSSSSINKFYIPISKLPALGAPDPRRNIAARPPSCCPDYNVPRHHRIMQRWQSMPRLRSQLPLDSLQIIQAATRRDRPGSTQRLVPGSGRFSGRGEGQPRLSGRQDTDARLAHACKEAAEGSARGRRENPYIPCACCDHKVEKSWMPKAETPLQGSPMPSGRALRGASPNFPPGSGRGITPSSVPSSMPGSRSQASRTAGVAFEEDRSPGESSRSQREKHSVSWEEQPTGSQMSGAESDDWDAVR